MKSLGSITFGFYNENTASNAPYLYINGVRFYFSYRTLVAVHHSKGLCVSENRWTTTTGKHLNWLDGGSYASKKERCNELRFRKELKRALREARITELPEIRI